MEPKGLDLGNEAVSMGWARQLFSRGIDAVRPDALVRNQVTLTGSKLCVKNEVTFDLSQYDRILVAGKPKNRIAAT